MHELTGYSDAEIVERIDSLWDFGVELCDCDDFEVDDGYVVRQCPWNDVDALEYELERRDRGRAL